MPFMKLTPILACSLIVAAVAAVPAFAALGEDVSSVQADVARMKGALRVTSTTALAVHEITMSDGTAVREYLSPAGKVFAVAWSGPFMPNLQQMLGTYYPQYEQAASALHYGHRHMAVEAPGLIVQSSGRLRAFSGRAWVPALLPPNFSIDEIK
jgi:hypothetical protein